MLASLRWAGFLCGKGSSQSKASAMLDITRLEELFFVDGALGKLTMKVGYKSKRSGDVISSIGQSGRYRLIRIDGVACSLHRIIWEMINGEIPEGKVIDHINGDTKDNRLCNLRICSQADNLKNRKIHSNNRSGVKGVYFDQSGRSKNKWRAQIRVNGKKFTIGRFPTCSDAKKAYDTAAKKFHGDFARQ
ncbi:hypothetical protein SRABI106_01462 [Rahnella aquatilis]|nr:hypothetical protein SRABI106_01462 [Rahnella aquatilis]